MYILGVTIISRIMSMIGLGTYVYVMLSLRAMLIAVLYIINMNFVNLNYKLILLRMLPLPAFFIKMCSQFVVLYYIMLFSYINFLL